MSATRFSWRSPMRDERAVHSGSLTTTRRLIAGLRCVCSRTTTGSWCCSATRLMSNGPRWKYASTPAACPRRRRSSDSASGSGTSPAAVCGGLTSYTGSLVSSRGNLAEPWTRSWNGSIPTIVRGSGRTCLGRSRPMSRSCSRSGSRGPTERIAFCSRRGGWWSGLTVTPRGLSVSAMTSLIGPGSSRRLARASGECRRS